MVSARERADMTGFAGKGSYYDLEKGQGFPHPAVDTQFEG